MSATLLKITATGGCGFHVSLDGRHLGMLEFGSIDADGQYEQDDDEIIDAARESFGIPDDVLGVVR